MHNPPKTVPIVSPDIHPEVLWKEYISKRLPVILDGHPPDEAWHACRWTNKYLKERAGHCIVSVEHRFSTIQDGFGEGKMKKMLFGEFLNKIEQGDERWYLSSQEQPIGPHGFPEVMTEPVLTLAKDIPLRLQWSGQLVPQQINMWMGTSVEGSSTGLHHDYHDNFYVLLRGRKRFRLYPPPQKPEEMANMYVYGQVKKVYNNGRVVYKGQEGIRADGSHIEDVTAWKYDKKSSHVKKKRHVRLIKGTDEEKKDQQQPLDNPPSFSKVDVQKDSRDILKQFPNFPTASMLQVELMEGQSLYLPAGWFHEVTSRSLTVRKDGHLAVNFWYHPPTSLEGNSFIRPYKSRFWQDMWDWGKITGISPYEERERRERKGNRQPQQSNKALLSRRLSRMSHRFLYGKRKRI